MLRRLALALLLALAGASGAAAQGALAPEARLEDPALEARAVALHRQLRCLVCQNQSIAESNAELAHDLRELVRERIRRGDSDREVLDFLVARYGDWVLLEPPVKRETWLLWFGPGLLLCAGAIGLALWYRRRRGRPAAAPLSAEEEARLAALVREPD